MKNRFLTFLNFVLCVILSALVSILLLTYKGYGVDLTLLSPIIFVAIVTVATLSFFGKIETWPIKQINIYLICLSVIVFICIAIDEGNSPSFFSCITGNKYSFSNNSYFITFFLLFIVSKKIWLKRKLTKINETDSSISESGKTSNSNEKESIDTTENNSTLSNIDPKTKESNYATNYKNLNTDRDEGIENDPVSTEEIAHIQNAIDPSPTTPENESLTITPASITDSSLTDTQQAELNSPVKRHFIFKKQLAILSLFILISSLGYLLMKDCYEVVQFDDIKGLDSETIQNKDVLFEVNNNVVSYTFRSDYIFAVKPINITLLDSKESEFSGTAEQFNHYVKELLFLKLNENTSKILIGEIGKGGVEAVSDMVGSIFKMALHPIETIKTIGSAGDSLLSGVADLISGEKTLEDYKNDIKNFASEYWYNKKCDVATEYNVSYQNIVYPETNNIIEIITKNKITGAGIVEVGTCFFAFTKIGKLSKLKYITNTRYGKFLTFKSLNKINKAKFNTVSTNKFTNLVKAKGADASDLGKLRTRITKREIEIYSQAGTSEPRKVSIDGINVNVRQKDITGNKEVKILENDIQTGKKKTIDKTNCDLMKEGIAPYDTDGTKIELHHSKQENVLTENKGYYVELSKKEHSINYNDLHFRESKSSDESIAHDKFRKKYWQTRYNQICL